MRIPNKTKEELTKEIFDNCNLFNDSEDLDYLNSLTEKELTNLYFQFLIPIVIRFKNELRSIVDF